MSKIFDLWNTVAGAFGPSGREDAVRETIAEIAGAYAHPNCPAANCHIFPVVNFFTVHLQISELLLISCKNRTLFQAWKFFSFNSRHNSACFFNNKCTCRKIPWR